MRFKRIFLCFTLIIFFCVVLGANNLTVSDTSTFGIESDRDSINKPLLRNLSIGVATLYGGSIFGLYHLWYKDYPQSNFHFFNDNEEWMQVDKIGHATSAYYISMIGYEAMSLTGVGNNKSALIGGSLGMAYLLTVEVFDGFSAGWGASPGDLLANFTGTSAFISQQLIWKEQRIRLKWSYHPTKYAAYRPDVLGSNGIQRALKDYNGHTYWLSANLSSFMHKESAIPKWLNIAVGYSATGMTGAFNNVTEYNGTPIPPFDRYRKYYLSADIDLSRIKVRSKTLSLILKSLNFIKVPMPAISVSKNGFEFIPLYY